MADGYLVKDGNRRSIMGTWLQGNVTCVAEGPGWEIWRHAGHTGFAGQGRQHYRQTVYYLVRITKAGRKSREAMKYPDSDWAHCESTYEWGYQWQSKLQCLIQELQTRERRETNA